MHHPAPTQHPCEPVTSPTTLVSFPPSPPFFQAGRRLCHLAARRMYGHRRELVATTILLSHLPGEPFRPLLGPLRPLKGANLDHCPDLVKRFIRPTFCSTSRVCHRRQGARQRGISLVLHVVGAQTLQHTGFRVTSHEVGL
jgi:hypothetical protein